MNNYTTKTAFIQYDSVNKSYYIYLLYRHKCGKSATREHKKGGIRPRITDKVSKMRLTVYQVSQKKSSL